MISCSADSIIFRTFVFINFRSKLKFLNFEINLSCKFQQFEVYLFTYCKIDIVKNCITNIECLISINFGNLNYLNIGKDSI